MFLALALHPMSHPAAVLLAVLLQAHLLVSAAGAVEGGD